MNDVEKRRRWKTKLNDWQGSSRDPPTRPGYKTQMLGELRAAVGADILPFVAFPTDDSLTLFDHIEHVRQQNQQVGWTGVRERPSHSRSKCVSAREARAARACRLLLKRSREDLCQLARREDQ